MVGLGESALQLRTTARGLWSVLGKACAARRVRPNGQGPETQAGQILELPGWQMQSGGCATGGAAAEQDAGMDGQVAGAHKFPHPVLAELARTRALQGDQQ